MKASPTLESKKQRPAPKASRPPVQPEGRPWFAWVLTALALIWLLASFRQPKPDTAFDLREFGSLPVLTNGRIQPWDSVARNSLMLLREKQTWLDESGKSRQAIEWLIEVLTKQTAADTRKVFRIDNPQIKTLLGATNEQEKFFSFEQILGKIDEVQKQVELASKVEEGKRDLFQRDMLKLHRRLVLYNGLKNSIQPDGVPRFSEELQLFQSSIGAGIAAVRGRTSGTDYKQQDLELIVEFTRRYERLSKVAGLRILPPLDSAKPKDAFENIGESLLSTIPTQADRVHPGAMDYAKMADAYRAGDATTFNAALSDYRGWLEKNLPKSLQKAGRETFFNNFAPFYKALTLYVVVFLFACFSWVLWPRGFGTAAVCLLTLTFFVHTSGLAFRMFLEGRPPVTNLYSSAIFIGWAAVALGLAIEWIFRNGIGAAVSSAMGFCTLIIAHHLAVTSETGDTMEMMRAVLDSNFWLGTHVVAVTLGYAATYFAGFVAIAFVALGLFTRLVTPELRKVLSGIIYGIICFATLFSFVGTVLGGIWADQSWGRFWGWDPKENGALLIVLWNALILHARWGGYVKARGLAACAIFGNVITSLSWFGVNMLGIGLHSYGFIDKTFFGLMAFIVSQLVLIVLTLVPMRFWRSFRDEQNLRSAAPAVA